MDNLQVLNKFIVIIAGVLVIDTNNLHVAIDYYNTERRF